VGDVEVTSTPQIVGAGDGAWHAAPTDDRLSESLRLDGQMHECVLIADALHVLHACLDSGLCTESWRTGDWTPYSYTQLDGGHPEDYELMCDAICALSRVDAREQAAAIISTCDESEHGREVRNHMLAVAQRYIEADS